MGFEHRVANREFIAPVPFDRTDPKRAKMGRRRFQSDSSVHLSALEEFFQTLEATDDAGEAEPPSRSMASLPSSPVFDMDLLKPPAAMYSPSTSFISSRDPGVKQLDSSPMVELLHACKPSTPLEVQLYQLLQGSSWSRCQRMDVEHLATSLLALGFLVQVRDGTTASASTRLQPKAANPKSLRLGHRFIVCTGYTVGFDQVFVQYPIIVEAQFRQQFCLAHATASYTQLLQAVPKVFIGTLDKLQTAVAVLSGEMRSAFQELGRPLPPWRSQTALMSKWTPEDLVGLAALLSQVALTQCSSLSASSLTFSSSSETTGDVSGDEEGRSTCTRMDPADALTEATQELQAILSKAPVTRDSSEVTKQLVGFVCDNKAVQPAWNYLPHRSDFHDPPQMKRQHVSPKPKEIGFSEPVASNLGEQGGALVPGLHGSTLARESSDLDGLGSPTKYHSKLTESLKARAAAALGAGLRLMKMK